MDKNGESETKEKASRSSNNNSIISRRCSDFSIDSLLRSQRENETETSSQSSCLTSCACDNSGKHKCVVPSEDEFYNASQSAHQVSYDPMGQTLSWLNCTRFKPPRLPRSRKRGVVLKRQGRGPRIPFSPQQITVLESTFVRSQYLSSDSIRRLANALSLSEIRVKIWFQNRRARYRRERDGGLVELSKASSVLAKQNNAPPIQRYHFGAQETPMLPTTLTFSSQQTLLLGREGQGIYFN